MSPNSILQATKTSELAGSVGVWWVVSRHTAWASACLPARLTHTCFPTSNGDILLRRVTSFNPLRGLDSQATQQMRAHSCAAMLA